MIDKLFIHTTEDKIIQLFRYGLVVIIAAPIDLGGYIILKSVFDINYILAATISFCLSLLANYALSVRWVWKRRSGRQRKIDAIVFSIIGFIGLLLTDLFVYVFTDQLHFNYIFSKLIAFVIVFFWSFTSRRYLFSSKSSFFTID